ncbi:ATP-binding protein [Candidatus Liberibacter africanus]|uniref:ATP-binding protein n=1 Tax=Liberibacter africanus TaxID=34020 RepID=UPI001AEA80E1|nr:ATP-binding protein [Candidatus Liberibacter africanus]
MLPIVSIDQRLSEKKGIKGCIFGESGIGKTSLLWTLPEESTLFVDLEAGDLPVKEWKGDVLRPTTWQGLRDLAVFFAGANPSLGDKDVPYSQKHYDAVCARFGDAKQCEKYETIFIDSITCSARMCFRHCEQQPEMVSRGGQIDIRSVYGLHAKEMLNWISHLQRARTKNIWLVGILDRKTDDCNIPFYSFQIEGQKQVLNCLVSLMKSWSWQKFQILKINQNKQGLLFAKTLIIMAIPQKIGRGHWICKKYHTWVRSWKKLITLLAQQPATLHIINEENKKCQ